MHAFIGLTKKALTSFANDGEYSIKWEKPKMVYEIQEIFVVIQIFGMSAY